MTISAAYVQGRCGLSFELFPPKTEAGEAALLKHVERLLAFRPSYITCTYGAGGSTRDKTLKITTRVKARFGVPVASHLTCVGATTEQLRQYLAEARDRAVDDIVALRGDPPRGAASFQPVAGGLHYASELVTLIRREFPQFGIAVAGYPEKHQEAPSLEVDIDNLRRKVDCGADVVITQLFYNNDDFFRFRARCRQAGIGVPIVPGLLPITSLAQIERITSLCGAHLPPALVSRLAERDNPDWQAQVGIDFATRQVEELLGAGVPGLHFYVLNQSQATSAVLSRVSLPR